MNLSEQRLKTSQAPNYGMKEGDLLAMKQTVSQLVSANNNHHQIIQDYEHNVKEKVMQTFYMAQVILKILVDHGVVTVEEIDELTKQVQSSDNGYSSKAPELGAEKGDLLLFSFIIYTRDGEVVEDKSKEVLAYNLGSNGLPCDEQLVGIRRGELRHLSVVFGEGFSHKQFIGQELMFHVTCHDVQIKKAQKTA